MNVKFLHKKQIEKKAYELLASYGQQFGEIAQPPIPVDAIIESHLQIDLRFGKLSEELSQPDVLGAIWINEKEIKIDESLDTTVNPRAEGRYQFTVAHEAGHWVLHRHQFLESIAPSFFDGPSRPTYVCRTSKKKEPIEIQSDTFASFLLMPKHLVLLAWERLFGSTEPYIAVDEIADLSKGWGQIEERQPTVGRAKQMAQLFNVSGQAMQIRLCGLGLIRTEKPEPNLFS